MTLSACLPSSIADAVSFLCYFSVVLLALPIARWLLRTARHLIYTDLASIPSPPLSLWKKITTGHDLLTLMTRMPALDAADQYKQWREEHGPLVKVRSLFGSASLVTTSEDSIRIINITRHHNYLKPVTTRRSLGTLIGQNGILLAEGEMHTKLRRAAAPSLHHDALVAVEEIFLREGDALACSLLSAQSSGSSDVLRDVRERTFKVIIDTIFGKNSVSQEDFLGLRDAYLETFLEPPPHVLKRVLLQTVLSFIPCHYFGWREDLRAYIRKTVLRLCSNSKDTVAQGGETTTLLSLMVDKETNRRVSEGSLVDTILSFLTAGQATTSMAVCWMLYLLAKDSIWQDTVLSELQENWTASDGLDALDRLPILSRVVRECLRLYPPIFYMARTTARDEELEGYRIPAGINVRIPILAVHRNVEIWGEDANEFNPDRFLKEGEIARTKMFWLPFLHGPRNCIGQRFAVLEIKAFVAQVLLRHRVYIKPLEDAPPVCYGIFATPRGLKLYFEPR